MADSDQLDSGETLAESLRSGVMAGIDELRNKTEKSAGPKYPPESQSPDEAAAAMESSVKSKLRKLTERDGEFESLKRELYGDRTINMVNRLSQLLEGDAEVDIRRAAVIVDPDLEAQKLIVYVKVLERLPETLKNRVSKAMKKEFKIAVKFEANCDDSILFSNCGDHTKIWYQMDGERPKDDGDLEVEILFWHRHRTGRDAVCVFPYHMMHIEDHPDDPGECIKKYNASSLNTKLIAKNATKSKEVELKKPINMHDFSPSHEEPAPEDEHHHFTKDIIVAPFHDYSSVSDGIGHLFDIPIQAEKVLKLNREILLRMSAANVAIYVADLEGYMTLPVVHGVKKYHRYLNVEFRLLYGELVPGQCGKAIYVKKCDGERLKIAFFTARSTYTTEIQRYKAAALSPNLEGLKQRFGLYMGDEERDHFDIYEEVHLTEMNLEEQFYTKGDLRTGNTESVTKK